MAAYKLVPILLWQRQFPRQVSIFENMPAKYVWMNMLHFLPGPFDGHTSLWPGQSYANWEYNAFMGWPALLAAAVGLALSLTGKKWRRTAIFALTMILIGWSLSLGNLHPQGLGQVFQFLPFLNDVRVFGRYEIMVIFGVAILAALGMRALARGVRRLGHMGGLVLVALALIIVAPATAEFASLVWHVSGVSDAVGLAYFASLGQSFEPTLVNPDGGGYEAERLAIEQGYWVGKCYEVINIPRLAFGARTALSDPPGVFPWRIGSSHLVLAVANNVAADIKLNLVSMDHFQVSLPYTRVSPNQITITGATAHGQMLVIKERIAGTKGGLIITAISFLLTLLMCWVASGFNGIFSPKKVYGG